MSTTTTTTTTTTTFAQDFQTWRKNLIKSKYSTYATDTSSLTAEKFIALSTVQDVTDSTTNKTSKTDVVKDEADSYLMKVILYHLDDKGLKALDTSKPTLSDDLLSTFSDSGYSAELTKYAKLWLLSSIHQQNLDTKTPSRVKGDAVEKDFKALHCGKIITTIIMRLTFLATAVKCPSFLPYLYNSDTMTPLVQQYLLADTYKATWVETTFNQIKGKLDTETSIDDNQRFNELKAKLESLDPSLGLSTTVLNEYYSLLFALCGPITVKNSPKVQKLYKKVTLKTIKKILAQPTHEWYDILVQAKDLFKVDVASMAGQISRALFRMACGNLLLPSTLSPEHVLTFDSAAFMSKLRKQKGPMGSFTDDEPSFKKFWADQKIYRCICGIYIFCNAAAIFSGFKSYDKMTKVEQVLQWVHAAVSGVDAVVSVVEAAKSGYNAYLWIGTKIKALMTPANPPIRQAVAATNVSKFAKYLKIGWIVRYITAALVVVSMAFTVYDIVTSIQNQDWGMLSLSIVEFALEFGVLVLTFMTATSWSGPVCLILTAALIVVGLVKMFWENIKAIFHDIAKFFDKLFNGDPTDRFVMSTEDKYHITHEEDIQMMLDALDKYALEHPNETAKVTSMRELIMSLK